MNYIDGLVKVSITYKDQEKIHEDVKILIQYQNEDIVSKIIIIENSIKETKEYKY